MEIVNGFVCMNCCDVTRRAWGRIRTSPPTRCKSRMTGISGFGPAVTFGGTLQATTTGASGDATATAGPPESSQTGSAGAASTAVNLLV